MAVYTEVTFDDAAALVDSVGLGALQALAPCKGGIENTNYFADTAQGRYVLTVFERLRADEERREEGADTGGGGHPHPLQDVEEELHGPIA